MEDLNRLVLLYDYYGDFLTQRQREIFELYYLNDLSLGEIAENTGITRQGVHDMVRRSQETLKEYEKNLSMVSKSLKLESKVQGIIEDLHELELLLKEGGE